MTDACSTVAGLLDRGRETLEAGGIENVRSESRLLLEHAGNLTTAEIMGYPERILAPGIAERFDEAVRRRAGHEPLAHITGSKEFWSLSFRVSPATLIPRPDSETLIDALLGLVGDHQAAYRVLDLGSGSGCLLAALLSELPNATGLGVDASAEACVIARQNLADLGFQARAEIRHLSWEKLDEERFDLILCNPPYITDRDLDVLDSEVRDFEPRPALAGGVDGLDAYRVLAPLIGRWLGQDGAAAVEFGAGQHDQVRSIFTVAGLNITGTHQDIAGRERCVLATVGESSDNSQIKVGKPAVSV